MTTQTAPLDTWAIVEMMGHVRIAGKLTEESHFGVALGRVDVPNASGGVTTQFFGGSSVYRITPTTEEIARVVALNNTPEPVSRWDLRALLPKPAPNDAYGEDDSDDSDDSGKYDNAQP